MTKLRFVAIAALLLAGCRKETPAAAERGSSPVPAATAAPSGAPDPAGAADPPAPGAPDPAGPVGTPAPRPPDPVDPAGTPAPRPPDPAGPVGTPAPRPPDPADPAGTPGQPGPHPAVQGSNAKPTGKAPGPATLPLQGQPCAEGRCAAGLACVEYYGIAGPRGPRFTSCEIRCAAGGSCPAGQQCITIADGPGTVCRP